MMDVSTTLMDMSTNTRWHHFIAWFFGAGLLTNFVPHFVSGVTGNAFQSPFATPPGVGLSTSTENVVWAFINLALAWLLLRIGAFEPRRFTHVLPFASGLLLFAVYLSRYFGKLHGGLP